VRVPKRTKLLEIGTFAPPTVASTFPSLSSDTNASTSSTASNSRLRASPSAYGGTLTPAAASPSPFADLLPSSSRVSLVPKEVSQGHSNRAARIERQLRDPNKKRLNHALAYHIEKTKEWKQLVPLCFEHMHHMTAHNYVRSMKRLVRLSGTRPLHDIELYDQFGRFMVQVEVKLSDLSDHGLMRHVFVPYHYLRNCLRQMRMELEKRVESIEKDREQFARTQRHYALQHDIDRHEAQQERTIDQVLQQRREHRAERFQTRYTRASEKTKKMRSQERRAGRAFLSVKETKKKKEGGSYGALRTTDDATIRKG